MGLKLYEFKDYAPKVENLFKLVSLELIELIPFARVEHIGSSSVEGSISKGDLDVFVGVPLNRFNECLDLIKTIHFIEKEDTFRSEEICMLVTDKFHYDVAIQLIANGSEFEDFIHFRDKLRSSKLLVEEYNQVKLSAQHLSPDLYRKEKSVFIERVLKSSH